MSLMSRFTGCVKAWPRWSLCRCSRSSQDLSWKPWWGENGYVIIWIVKCICTFWLWTKKSLYTCPVMTVPVKELYRIWVDVSHELLVEQSKWETQVDVWRSSFDCRFCLMMLCKKWNNVCTVTTKCSCCHECVIRCLFPSSLCNFGNVWVHKQFPTSVHTLP